MSRQKVQYGTSSDYSEGLMGEIQRLIAPPNEEYKRKPQNPFKRGGRHNHDTCDSCAEPGNLICCDYCTASFHLTCHDPPLEETDIPTGLWHCHTCRTKEKYAREKEEKEAAKRAAIIGKLEPVQEVEVLETPQIDAPVEEVEVKVVECCESDEIAPMQVNDEIEKQDGDVEEEKEETTTEEIIAEVCMEVEENLEKEKTPSVDLEEEQPPEEEDKLTPFEELIRVASLLNPKQFELPVQMTEHFPFPGSDRVDAFKNGRRVKTKRLVELDLHGCVPMPAKFCFSCNKTCKKAPLVSCDYCSLYFHQDCLDPPMTALPSGRWMCPNHPQHFIDWNLVSSISATERMKVWNEFGTESIDHEVVKLQFFRKVHMRNPPFRSKLKRKPRDEVEVPEIIKHQYENPPQLLPSLRDVYRVDNLRKRGTNPVNAFKDDFEQINEDLDALANARKRLKSIFEDQEDVHGLLIEPENEIIEDEKEKSTMKSPRSRKSKSTNIEKEIKVEIEETKMEVDLKESKEIDENEPKVVSECENFIEKDQTSEEKLMTEKSEIENSKSESSLTILTSNEMKAINQHLENLNDEAIKLLAFQRFQQIVNENPNFIQKFQNQSTSSESVISIAKWDIQRFPIPASTNEENVENQDVTIRLRETPFHLRNEQDKAHSISLSLERPLKKSRIRSRAVLTFANDYLSGRVWFSVAPNMDLSVFMRYRNFTIGHGAENDLDLSRYGHCAFVSNKHSVIFFDDVTKQFELMNYSEFGTEVNGQLYSCDFTEHSIEICETPTSPLKDKRVAVQSKIKNMIDAKKKIREGMEKQANEIKMSAIEPPLCECRGRSTMKPGWEGTALLQHGYLLRFGCLAFVFSIAEYDSGNDSDP